MMKGWLAETKPFWCGVLIGTMGILPGVSGGALAAALGYYELLIFAAAHPWKAFKSRKITLTLLAVGIAVGVVLVGRLFLRLFEAFPTAMRCAVAGTILATLLPVTAEKPSPKLRWKKGMLEALALAVGLFLFIGNVVPPLCVPFRFGEWMLCGGIYAFGTVVPGISASCILLSMGAYEKVLSVIAGENLRAIVPFLAGFLLASAGLVCIVNSLYTAHKTAMEAVTTGLVVASVFPVVPPLSPDKFGVMAVLCGLLCFGATMTVRARHVCKDK